MTSTTAPDSDAPNLTGELQLRFQDRIVRRDLQVVRTEDVTPRYRRVVLGGEVLTAGYPFVRFACTDHVKCYFPDPGTGRVVAYRETADGGWTVDSSTGAPIRRDYTVRGWDAQTRELTLDFVVHEHGIAGRWARGARPGDPLVVMGPRANWLLPAGYRHYVAVGDETALPAISRIVEEAPAGSRVTAVVEVADAAEEQRLVPAEGVAASVRWVHRDTAPGPAERGSALEAAVRQVDLGGDPAGGYVFAAGEATAMKPIRRHLRHDLGLSPHQLVVDGYWRSGVADHDHHTDDLADDPEDITTHR